MAVSKGAKKRIVVSLDLQTLAKAKGLAAQRSRSIGQFLADLIEELIAKDEAYAAAELRARELMARGFDMGTVPRVSRDELHER